MPFSLTAGLTWPPFYNPGPPSSLSASDLIDNDDGDCLNLEYFGHVYFVNTFLLKVAVTVLESVLGTDQGEDRFVEFTVVWSHIGQRIEGGEPYMVVGSPGGTSEMRGGSFFNLNRRTMQRYKQLGFTSVKIKLLFFCCIVFTLLLLTFRASSFMRWNEYKSSDDQFPASRCVFLQKRRRRLC